MNGWHPLMASVCDVMQDYLRYLIVREKVGTAKSCLTSFRQFEQYLKTEHNPRHGAPDADHVLKATTKVLEQFRYYLSQVYKNKNGEPLNRETQRTRLVNVRVFYKWLACRQLMLRDIGAKFLLPKPVRKRTVLKDYVTQQEATALLETAADQIKLHNPGTRMHAIAIRDVALLGCALATGRRRTGLRDMHLDACDLDRCEMRVEQEKGVLGRVLPVADWAMQLIAYYIAEARPRLAAIKQASGQGEPPWLFLGRKGGQFGNTYLSAHLLPRLVRLCCQQNPDLTELAGKKITSHSLRVSFATMLFHNGCPIRSLNELMLHNKLSTTARYTPIPIPEMRRIFSKAHPRA